MSSSFEDATFTTVPIVGDETVVHDQLPSSEEMKMEKELSIRSQKGAPGTVVRSSRTKRVLCVLIPSLLLVGAIIGLVVGLTSRNNNRSSNNSNLNAPVADRLTNTLNFLRESGISNAFALDDESSPQYKAAVWMANIDRLQLGLSRESSFLRRYALVVLYYALNGQSWLYSLDWLTPKSECEWSVGAEGIFCNDDEVTHLFLDDLKATGSLPPEIGYLTNLDIIQMFNNSIYGTIPSALYGLSTLRVLNLQLNDLTGSISPDIAGMEGLQNLYLSFNGLGGSIPDMTALTNLMEIGLDQNDILKGQVTVFYNLDKLQKLYLDHNDLSGELTDEFFTGLPNLEEFLIGRNVLTSSLPGALFSHETLKVVDLHLNHFTGSIPKITASNMSMELLALYNNSLGGPVPSSIAKLGKLRYLDLSNNNFTSIPTAIGKLTKLEYLFMAGNDLEPHPFPAELENLVQLTDLSLQNSRITGNIPEFVGTTLTNLRLLDLSRNQLTGEIPSLTALQHLFFLFLNHNNLTDSAVEPIYLLKDLAIILLDHNDLRGNFNSYCTRLSKLNFRFFYADCDNGEITCKCCRCCAAGNATCNSEDWLGTYVPLWEYGYFPRNYYSFNNENVLYTLS